MKVEGLLFALYAMFLVMASAVYWLLSFDPTGTTCILLSGGLAFIVGYYLMFTARRMEARPEDRADAEISEGAGEMGFFSPHSWWPIYTAGAFSVTIIGLVFGPWLVLIGLAFLAVTVSGFLFEYYVGINRSQGQTLQALEAMGESPTSPHKFLGD
ncbi:MAG TPA: cytochrome c oxidase subunit 4 [Mycobacteriales bacterium]|nr:cytochrome c oxidase subunit 4 [Mycobacteriales bacterium]